MKTCNYLIMLSLISSCIGCFNPADYNNPYPADKLINFTSADNQNVLGDGISPADVQVVISKDAVPGKRAVIFKTNSGYFLGSKRSTDTVEADNEFNASAQLANPNATTATVSATIMNTQTPTNRTVIFTKAYPTEIFVSVDSFAVVSNYNGEVLLKATLRADKGGVPSVGHEVRFRVVKDKTPTESIGDFLNNHTTASTDANGIARIRYSPGKTGYEGYATIIASTDKSINPKDTTVRMTRIFIRK